MLSNAEKIKLLLEDGPFDAEIKRPIMAARVLSIDGDQVEVEVVAFGVAMKTTVSPRSVKCPPLPPKKKQTSVASAWILARLREAPDGMTYPEFVALANERNIQEINVDKILGGLSNLSRCGEIHSREYKGKYPIWVAINPEKTEGVNDD